MEHSLTTIPSRMVEAWNRADPPGFFADFADDAVFTEFEGTILRGREQMIAATQPVFDTVMKGSRLVGSEIPYAHLVQPGLGVIHHRAAIALPGEEEPPGARRIMQLFVVALREDRWQVTTLQNARLVSLEAAAALESLPA